MSPVPSTPPLPARLAGTGFARGDARAAGVVDGALARRHRAGRVVRLGPDAWCDAACTDRERATVAAVQARVPGAVASHLTAARLWGIDAGARCAHVTVPPATSLRSWSGFVVHRDALADHIVVGRHGLALTEPYRTALDVARSASSETAVVVADVLLWMERIEREELLDRLSRLARRRGVARARRALGLCRYGSASPGETRLRLALVTRGIPEPELQYPLRCAGHSLVADLCWPAARLVVEYDGFGPHTERHAFERDRQRWSWLRGDRWELRVYTAESLRRPDVIAAEIRALLRA